MWKYCVSVHINYYDKNFNIAVDDDAYVACDDGDYYLASVKEAVLFDAKDDAISYAKNVLKLKKSQYKCKRFSDKVFIKN